MPIHTIETIVNIEEDRRLVVQLPADVPLGRHRVVAVVDVAAEEADSTAGGNAKAWAFPIMENAKWPNDMLLGADRNVPCFAQIEMSPWF